MLPRLRLVLVTIITTVLMVVLGFTQLVKLQVAHDQTARLGPVEARFAGLAFAARADWAPAPHPGQRSLESLAPFANIPPDQPRTDGDTAAAPPAADPPAIRLAALAPPSADPAPELTSAEAAQLALAIAAPALPEIPSAVGPESQATRPLAGTEPVAEALPQPPAQIAAIPADIVTGQIQAAAPGDLTEPNTVRLPTPRTDVASLPDEAVRVPIPRPATAPPPQRNAQPVAATQKTARTPVRKRRPPAKQPQAGTAPVDPLTALFGGANAAGNTGN